MWIKNRSQGLHSPVIEPQEEDDGQQRRHQFRDGEGPPDQGDFAEGSQEHGDRDQNDQLSSNRDDQGVVAVGEGLEDGAHGDTGARQAKGKGDDPQGGNTYAGHFLGGIEHSQKDLGEQVEDQCSAEHDAHGQTDGELEGLLDAVAPARAVVVGEHGDESVVQTGRPA